MKLKIFNTDKSVKLTPWEIKFCAATLDWLPAMAVTEAELLRYKSCAINPERIPLLINACWQWETKHVKKTILCRDYFSQTLKIQPNTFAAGMPDSYLHRPHADRKDKLMDKLHSLLGTAETWDSTWPIQRKASYLQRILRPRKDMTWKAFYYQCNGLHCDWPDGTMKWSGEGWEDEAKAWLEKEGV